MKLPCRGSCGLAASSVREKGLGSPRDGGTFTRAPLGRPAATQASATILTLSSAAVPPIANRARLEVEGMASASEDAPITPKPLPANRSVSIPLHLTKTLDKAQHPSSPTQLWSSSKCLSERHLGTAAASSITASSPMSFPQRLSLCSERNRGNTWVSSWQPSYPMLLASSIKPARPRHCTKAVDSPATPESPMSLPARSSLTSDPHFGNAAASASAPSRPMQLFCSSSVCR
mmetsp:Transcript_70763/g.169403  ORF Transcript_70763/g.169403 Transcript_70763/m.169403 type:complete len:232 (-) Transcript_70763:1116-1811(-)